MQFSSIITLNLTYSHRHCTEHYTKKMGMRGLKKFLEREHQTRSICINDEINAWKRENPDKTPKIVIDFLNLAHYVAKKNDDTICGGRHQVALNFWREMLDALQASGCSFIFFIDLAIQKSKISSWLIRRNEKFELDVSTYQSINDDNSLQSIAATVQDSLSSTFYAMEAIAEGYGEFIASSKYECDLELAQYVKREKALAVITNDTDFLIFDGEWRLWVSDGIRITSANQLETTELDRNGLLRLCKLEKHQLPLFATLNGNDITKKYEDKLYAFWSKLGPARNRFQNIATYVRKFGYGNLSYADYERISYDLFGNHDMVELIRESVDSYNIDFLPASMDSLEKKLLTTSMYRPYVALMSQIQAISTPFYDMYHSQRGIHFPLILADWLKRKIGVLRQRKRNVPFTFTLLAKKQVNQLYMAHTEFPIYPDFEVPSLEQLYLGSNGDEMIDTKWEIFRWIMSLSDEVITALKKLPKKFLLICATLYALVKSGLINEPQADGILYTEWMVYGNKTMSVAYPKTLAAEFVRAAHLYNNAFEHVRLNFSIAGLLPFIQETLQFDGVYYQQFMEKMSNKIQRGEFIAPKFIKDYRIYAGSA